MKVDLHCHSHFSDGKDSVEKLLACAIAQGVEILALTDHDTVEGFSAMYEAARHQPIRIIPGIELSTRWKKYDIHVLGLNMNPLAPALLQMIARQKDARVMRGKLIGEKLAGCGIQHAYQKACEIAGHERVGRPHFAKVLVQSGLVPDVKTAFKRFLKAGRDAYVPTEWPSLEAVVDVIISSGGLAVIAHPLKYLMTRTKLHEFIQAFKQAGGQGLEVVSGEMAMNTVNELAGLCQRFDLWASTGSDYHGRDLSRIGVGQQRLLPTICKPIWHAWTKSI